MEIDYEKAYKEALERAKRLHGTVVAGRDFLAEIFPELAESEDERIRNELIELVRETVNEPNRGGITVNKEEKYIAWLEKQKESLHIPEMCKDNADSFTDEDERVREEIKEFIFKRADRGDLVAKRKKWIAYLEKQKEQEHTCDSAQYEEGFKTGLEIGLRKQKKQKPAEWSEEDKEILNDIVVFISGYADKRVVSRWVEFLKSLRPQPKQEWSEDDEMYLSQAIETLEHENYSILADKLKSLRPSWKPSEEQMEAFRSYIKDLQEKAAAEVGGWNKLDIMIRLYEQLKKLRVKEEPEYYQHFDPDC